MDNNSTKYIRGKIPELIDLSKNFIKGNGRYKNYVKNLEGLFAESELLDNDERFENLQYAFSMYGASSTSDHDNSMLEKCNQGSTLIPKSGKLFEAILNS